MIGMFLGAEPFAVPRNPWRGAAKVGLVAAVGLSSLTCAVQGAQFDWGAFDSSAAGALSALGLVWLAAFVLRRREATISAKRGQGRDPG